MKISKTNKSAGFPEILQSQPNGDIGSNFHATQTSNQDSSLAPAGHSRFSLPGRPHCEEIWAMLVSITKTSRVTLASSCVAPLCIVLKLLEVVGCGCCDILDTVERLFGIKKLQKQ